MVRIVEDGTKKTKDSSITLVTALARNPTGMSSIHRLTLRLKQATLARCQGHNSFRSASQRKKGSISLCIAFDNIKLANSLIQVGAYIHVSHC